VAVSVIVDMLVEVLLLNMVVVVIELESVVGVQGQPIKNFWQVALTGAPGPGSPVGVGGATVPRQYGSSQLISSGQPSSPWLSMSLGASVVVIIVVTGENPTVFEVLVVTQLMPGPEAVE
jgi:hypothetical protein